MRLSIGPSRMINRCGHWLSLMQPSSTTTPPDFKPVLLQLKFLVAPKAIIRPYVTRIHGDVLAMYWSQVSRKLEGKYQSGSPGPEGHSTLAFLPSIQKTLVSFEISSQDSSPRSTILFLMTGLKLSMPLMDLSLVNGSTCASTSACKPSSIQMTRHHLYLQNG